MTYKDELARAMQMMGQDPASVFIGYNVGCGGMANGTLKGIAPEHLIETPVAENLMVGMAIGMALDGRKPLVYIERFDFILNAMDAIVNHLDKIKLLSGGEFNPHILIRVLVGGTRSPLYTGPTHTQDFSSAMREFVSFDVLQLKDPALVYSAYEHAFASLDQKSTMLVEYRDLYNETVNA